MTRFKTIRLTAIGALAAMTMSACMFGGDSSSDEGPSSVGTEAPVELSGELTVESFYPEGSPDYERLEALAADFEALHPDLNVTIAFLGGADRAGQEAKWRAGNPPEVNLGFFDATKPDGGQWVVDGKVLELDDAMQRPLEDYDMSWNEAILPGVRPLIQAGGTGKTYGAPESVTTIQFFYNKKLFADNDIDVPTTFDELLGAADKLKAAGVAPFTVTGTFIPYMQLYFDYLGLRYVGAEGMQQALAGETDLASLPGASEAAAALEELAAQDNLLSGFKSTDFTAAQMAFFQGKAGMILMGSWLVGEMKDAIPADFEIGTFAFPTIDGASGDQQGLFGGVNAQVVSAEVGEPRGGRGVAPVRGQQGEPDGVRQGHCGSISPYRSIEAPPGFDDVSAALEDGAAFSPSYFGIFGKSQEVQAAYQQPIAKLFFGEINGQEMLQQISAGLAAQ